MCKSRGLNSYIFFMAIFLCLTRMFFPIPHPLISNKYAKKLKNYYFPISPSLFPLEIFPFKFLKGVHICKSMKINNNS